MQNKDMLVWMDMEMTGLTPEHDSILEIATIITTSSLELVAQGPQLIIAHTQEQLACMNDFVKQMHTASGLIDRVLASTTTLEQAESKTLDFIKHYCAPQQSPLCGNTIYQDRTFLRRYMPTINDYLHYRIIDVSSVKELIKHWYPNNKLTKFCKKSNHRALEDVYESVNELRHYRQNFFKEIVS